MYVPLDLSLCVCNFLKNRDVHHSVSILKLDFFFFLNSTYGPLAMCEHIEKKFILFHCLTVFHNKDVV